MFFATHPTPLLCGRHTNSLAMAGRASRHSAVGSLSGLPLGREDLFLRGVWRSSRRPQLGKAERLPLGLQRVPQGGRRRPSGRHQVGVRARLRDVGPDLRKSRQGVCVCVFSDCPFVWSCFRASDRSDLLFGPRAKSGVRKGLLRMLLTFTFSNCRIHDSFRSVTCFRCKREGKLCKPGLCNVRVFSHYCTTFCVEIDHLPHGKKKTAPRDWWTQN